jgi:hypothetical protein
MHNATETHKTYNGFAVEITDSTDLGLAMLIAESEDGHYEPIAVVANVREAREVARRDFRDRMRRPEHPGERMCPHTYKVWARGIDGEQRIACEIKDDLT